MIGGGGPSSQWIMKGILSFVKKGWWTFVNHRLNPTYGENSLSPDRASLAAGVMESYDIYVARLIAREIYERAVRIDIAMAFPYLLT